MNKIKEIFSKTNLKGIMRSTSVVLVIVYLVLSTFIYIDFNTKKFDFVGWLFNSSITVVLHMFGLAIGNSWGKDSQKAKENGLYRKALDLYQDIYLKISGIVIYFEDYLIWYKDRELIKTKVKFLQDNNISHIEAKNIVLYLEYQDIDELSEKPLKLSNGSVIRVKNDEQIKAIKETYKIKVKSPAGTYFLSYSNDIKFTNELEMATTLENARKVMVKARNLKNMFSGVVFSLLMGLVATSYSYKAIDMVGVINLIMRISVVFTSIFCGFNIAVDEVKMMANEIENKVNVLRAFYTCYSNKEFTPMDYETLAEKEYQEYLREQEEKVAKSVKNEEENIAKSVNSDKVELDINNNIEHKEEELDVDNKAK